MCSIFEGLEDRRLLSGAAPAAVADSYTTDEDTHLVINAPGVLANDTDPDGDTLTAAVVTQPAHGTLEFSPNGGFTYIPAANYNGADSFTYRANDSTSNSDPVTVSLTIAPVNDVPAAQNDAYSTGRDQPLTVAGPGVLANDTDADGDALSANLVSDVSHGTLALNPDGSFTYTPSAGYRGLDTFTYKANDGTADSATATVNITVNTAPVAAGESHETNEDTPLTIPAPGVLANDTDAEGDLLTAVVATSPAHGTLTLNQDGSFTYTPAANYNGADSFTYKANDGINDSAPATVSLTVHSVPDAPVAVNDTYTTKVNTALNVNAPGALVNDTDADGDPLTATLVDNVSHGTLVFNANGSFTYTPATDYRGTDTFTYKVNDGASDSNIATVTIDMNAVPVAQNDTYTTAEDTALTVPAAGVLSNDTDDDGDTITAAVVTNPSHGTLTLNADGSFTYTPAANYNGPDSFTYKAKDAASESAPATVSITVTSVNDAPVARDDQYSATSGQPLSINAASGVLANDDDADGKSSLTVSRLFGPFNGSLSLAANGSFSYTSNPGFVGTEVFTYRLSDGTATADATVMIHVNAAATPANTSPVASDFLIKRNPGAPAIINIRRHATDANNDPLAIGIVTQPQHGRAFVDNNGTPLDVGDDLVEYIPYADYYGPDSFTYRVSDGHGGAMTAQVRVGVRPMGLSPNPFNGHKSDLIILGSDKSDVIDLTRVGKRGVEVKINGLSKGIFQPTARVIVQGGGGNDSITATDLVQQVRLYGGLGADTLVASQLHQPAQLFGGSGNDRLKGGVNDLLDGGIGNNVIL